MSWIPKDLGFTVEELVRSGLSIEEACWVAWSQAPIPKSLCGVCKAAKATYWTEQGQPLCLPCVERMDW